MNTPLNHVSSRKYLVGATRDTPAHRLLTTMCIRWRGDRIEVHFAAIEMPATQPSGTAFGLAARRRKMDRL